MRGPFARRAVRWLTLLTAALASAWILLSTGGSAHADQPDGTPGQPDQPGLGQLVQPLVQPLGQTIAATVGTTADQVAQTLLPSLEVPQRAVDLAAAVSPVTSATEPPATAPAGAAAHSQPSAAAPQPAAPSVPALNPVVTAVLHADASHLDSVGASLSGATSSLTTTLATTTDALPSVVPALSVPLAQLQDTLASLDGTVDQLTTPTTSALTQALAPVQQLLAPRAMTTSGTAGAGAQAGHDDAPAGAATTPFPAGGHGAALLALPVLLPKTGSQAGPARTPGPLPTSVQPTASGLASRSAADELTSAPGAPDLGSLLAPGGGVPSPAPAADHNPPSPAPSGPDGAGHAHFALGIGALPTLLPMREATHSASSRLPLSPTFAPGESPD